MFISLWQCFKSVTQENACIWIRLFAKEQPLNKLLIIIRDSLRCAKENLNVCKFGLPVPIVFQSRKKEKNFVVCWMRWSTWNVWARTWEIQLVGNRSTKIKCHSLLHLLLSIVIACVHTHDFCLTVVLHLEKKKTKN